MGDTCYGGYFSNHNSNSLCSCPTFYYIGTLDPLGIGALINRTVLHYNIGNYSLEGAND